MSVERVILVNRRDEEIGTAEKLDAHLRPRLHRAFSVFVFNARGELLLQRRAADKYHSANLWTNTACGHPRPGEDVNAAAVRRLNEEMGIALALTECASFIYRARIDSLLTEYELDHVFVGFGEVPPRPDASEVSDWRWADVASVARALEDRPEQFTAWFSPAFRLARSHVIRRARCGIPEGFRRPSLR